MKETMRYGFILSVICLIAAGLLAGVNSLTKKLIVAQAQAEEGAALKEVLPGAEKFEAVTKNPETIYYKGSDKGGKFLGVVFKASGKGYSSVIETLVGMDKVGKITAIKVLSQNETPGLGMRVTEGNFTGQFANKYTRELSGVQAITGATISSRAVIDSVMKKAQEVQSLLQR
ncbi:MAG TPA: RnfABCDGE type electron transport complex subunit G [Candidatus Margulisiibacteriota bacterium]|nr:RnfABCDGE type electron transport complex subunit G [Candidatus Margulisiibacteriota bacterium]